MPPLLIIFNLPSTLAQETMAVSGNTVATAIFLSASLRGRERKKTEIVAELVKSAVVGLYHRLYKVVQSISSHAQT